MTKRKTVENKTDATIQKAEVKEKRVKKRGAEKTRERERNP